MENHTYVALLRGINVGGHKKVPMVELREVLEKMHFNNVRTLLNSGNVIFTTQQTSTKSLEKTIGETLKTNFGFPIPIIVREASVVQQLIDSRPFDKITVYKDIRLYVTFLKLSLTEIDLEFPWVSEDQSFKIIHFTGTEVVSVLDLSQKKTTDAMKIIEKTFGKDVTTRNWNTVLKIAKLV